jgi:hypothetical protein
MMQILYKLTTAKNRTYNGTTWGENVTHTKKAKRNPLLCSEDVLHAYTNINLALLINPLQADIKNPVIWEAQGDIAVKDWSKVGCFSLTTTKLVPIPEWYKNEKKRRQVQVLFAILCAEVVLHYFEDTYSTDKRVREAIEAAKAYLRNPTAEAARATEAAKAAKAAWSAAELARTARAAEAAWSAAVAAKATVEAAEAAWSAKAAAVAARAAEAAVWAARAAWVAGIEEKINFDLLADKAVAEIMKEDSNERNN